MSRLTDLLRQARKLDTQLGADLEAEFGALANKRSFGLVFEPHQPEAVELPGRPIRRGDKVRVLPPRGSKPSGDKRLWRVSRTHTSSGSRQAELIELDADYPESATVPVEDLVVVAEFRDRIYPGLIETGRVQRGGDKPFHTVINAENFHALEMLSYTHRHAIDVIYIDPPYNTGAKDWKYNNDYVESDDDYRHSKWLAFMERRLRIARELLNPDNSVLIVTIDEKELNRLGLLLQQSFHDAAPQLITTVINRKGNARRGEFSRCEEYLYVLRFGAASLSGWRHDMLHAAQESEGPVKIRWKSLLRLASTGQTSGRFRLFYPLFFDAHSREFLRTGDPLNESDSIDSVRVPDGETVLWPISRDGTDGRWSIGVEKFNDYLSKGYIRFGGANAGGRTPYYLMESQVAAIDSGGLEVVGRDEDGAVVLESVSRQKQPMTVWNVPSHSTSGPGTSLLRELLPDRRFPYPKSLYAVEDVLRFFVGSDPHATVLDFFSGSGTTAHAVMRLNRQDGGRRQSISITNNEVSAEEQVTLRAKGLRPGDRDWEALGICDFITKPRITAAITGTTPKGEPVNGDYKFTDEFPMSEGFEENAAFFSLTYESPLSVRHNRAFDRIAPILWLRAGSQGRIIQKLDSRGWDVADAYAVLENLDQVEQFVESLANKASVELAFIVTDDDGAFQMVCRELPESVTPVRLYESYLQNFEINMGRSL